MKKHTIDYIDKWIIKMFKFNERENNPVKGKYFINGIKLDSINLDEDELIFGCFEKSKKYYFTSKAFIIKEQNKNDLKIYIKDIVNTNGSFRSSHKSIYVETKNGSKHSIKISEFPYRIQQLFYQLIERHSTINKKPIYKGPIKLQKILKDVDENNKYNFEPSKKTTIKKIDLLSDDYKLYYYGILENRFIMPKSDGLIIKISNEINEFEIFNSCKDGYNGKIDNCDININNEFVALNAEIKNLILIFNYNIEDYEHKELMFELELKSEKEINDLYGSILIYAENDNEIYLLTEYETQ